MAPSNSSSISVANSKRLLFDRRYGWVIDEWKDPSEEALAGGRGMFCIVPMAKGLMDMASHSIDAVTNSTLKILEYRDYFSPQQLQATVGNQFQQLTASIQKQNSSIKAFNGKSLFPSTSSSLHQHKESSNMNEPEIL